MGGSDFESLYLEERRRREEAERGRDEEKRGREEAERRVQVADEKLRRLTLQEYLEACHLLQLSMVVITDPKLVTQGATTNPLNRYYPRRIIPWKDFAEQQQNIWDKLSISHRFFSQELFPSRTMIQGVQSVAKPMSSEDCLRACEKIGVENTVEVLLENMFMDPILTGDLGFTGNIRFQSHTNTSQTVYSSDRMPIDEDDSAVASASTKNTQRQPQKARGQGNRADRFCIYRSSGGNETPFVAIEYKAPHKLTVDEIVTGLASEIQPDHDVINKDGRDPVFLAKRLSAMVVTQLFSYMVGRKIRYGYLSTKEVLVFLNIPENDPSMVYYAVCVPERDVENEGEKRHYYTAAGQVFAFVVQALLAPPTKQSWHDTAMDLDRWPVEPDDILSRIPPSERKIKEPRDLSYRPRKGEKLFSRSPIGTRSRGRQLVTESAHPEEVVDGVAEPAHSEGGDDDGHDDDGHDDDGHDDDGHDDDGHDDDGHDDEDDDDPPSPTPNVGRCKPSVTKSARSEEDENDYASPAPNVGNKNSQAQSSKKATSGGRESGRKGTRHQSGQPQHQQKPQQRQEAKVNIKDRPYCTQRCLLGLAYGGPLDENCPNVHYHGGTHITRNKFLRLIRTQLAHDRDSDSDCVTIFIAGSRGSMFKVRLSSHGYTLVAKGMEIFNQKFLAHERRIYDKLRSIQGKCIPVCLGMIDLILPWYHYEETYVNFLFLGWAGMSIHHCIDLMQQPSCGLKDPSCLDSTGQSRITDQVVTGLRKLHELGVLHCDAEPRNVMLNPEAGSVMLIDFERSKFLDKPSLKSPNPSNGRAEKKRRNTGYEQRKEEELVSAVNALKRCFDTRINAPKEHPDQAFQRPFIVFR